MISPAYEAFVNDLCIDYKEANEGILGDSVKYIAIKFIIAPFLISAAFFGVMGITVAYEKMKYKKNHAKDYEDSKSFVSYITKQYQDASEKALKDSEVKSKMNAAIKGNIAKQLKENKDLVDKYNLSIKDFEIEVKKFPVNIQMPDFKRAGNEPIVIGNNRAQVKDGCLAYVSALKKETIVKFDETDAYFADKFVGVIIYDPIKKEIIRDYGYDKSIPENVIDREEYNRYIKSIKK